MKKRVISLMLVLCMLLLNGCSLLPGFSLDDLLAGFGKPKESVVEPEFTVPLDIPMTTEPSTIPVETTVVTEPTIPTMQWPTDAPYLPLYWDAINDFGTFLAHIRSGSWNGKVRLAELSDTFLSSFSSGSSLEDKLSNMIEELANNYQYNENDFGYILYDIDNDKVPELFWVQDDYTILAVFTVYKDKLKLVDAYWSRYEGYISSNGQFYTHGSSGATDNSTSVYILSKGKLQEVFTFGCKSDNTYSGYHYFEATPSDEITVDGYRISQLYDRFPANTVNYWRTTKIRSLDHVPEKKDAGASKTSGVKYIPYTQKVKRADQAAYKGPGYSFAWKGTSEKAATFTITAEVMDAQGNLWGRLKSGDGWINMTEVREVNSQTLRMTANFADPDIAKGNKYHSYIHPNAGDYYSKIAFYAYAKYTDVTLVQLVSSGSMARWEELYSLASMDTKKPIIATVPTYTGSEQYGIFFKDKNGTEHFYILGINRANGELTLTPNQNN